MPEGIILFVEEGGVREGCSSTTERSRTKEGLDDEGESAIVVAVGVPWGNDLSATDRVFGVATIDSACFYDFLSLWAGGLWIWVSRGFSSLWSQDRRSGVYGLESSSRTSIDSDILRRLKPSEVFFID